MQVGGRGARALFLAAVLGIVGGLTAGFLVAPSTDRPDVPTTGDPLHLGIPLVDQYCSGRSIMVVGWGDERAPLAAAVADNTAGAVRYLRVADSCPTLYGREGAPAPEYAAYLGPFDDLAQACAERMSVEHKGDSVTRLHDGNQIHVQCVCELPTDTFPELSVGMPADPADGIWIRALQGLLDDIGRNPSHHVNGFYDQRTAEMVRQVQSASATAANGVVDQVMWRILRDRACGTYSY